MELNNYLKFSRRFNALQDNSAGTLKFIWEIRPDLQNAFSIETKEGYDNYMLWWFRHGFAEYQDLAKKYFFSQKLNLFDEQFPDLYKFMRVIYDLRKDLQQKYFLNDPSSISEYKDWWEKTGFKQYSVLESFLKNPPSQNSQAESTRELLEGVNIIGYASHEIGIGEDTRIAAKAVGINSIPYTLVDTPWGHPSTRISPGLEIKKIPDRKVNLVYLPVSDTFNLFGHSGELFFKDRFNIGCFQWEFDNLLDVQKNLVTLVDEIWSSTSFTATAFQNSTKDITVKHMPMAVDITTHNYKVFSRQDYSLPEGVFLFLFTFDSLSTLHRKNPMAVITAFQKSFPLEMKNAGLVVKTMNANPSHEIYRKIMEIAALDSRIRIVNETLSRDKILGLFHVCDAYVSLHRSEGFGRTLAEAMLMEKPVIATNYSGNTDFCNEQTSYLVDGPLISVKPGEYSWAEGLSWCDPDIDMAAEQMKKCFSDVALSKAIAAAGRKLIETNYNPDVVGKRYKARLQEIGVL